jgi:hypothetical protein
MLIAIWAAHAAEPAATCESVPPGKNQYRLAVGYATAKGNSPAARNAALAIARLNAEQQLAGQLCAVMPDTCSAYRGYIQAWQTPGVYDEKSRQACATAVIESWLLQPDALRREAESRMGALADALGKALGKEAVAMGELRRSDGCAIPELDPARMWVRSRLAAAGVTVYDGDAPAGTPRLDLEATVAAGRVTLGATVHRPDGRIVAVDPVQFASAAYGVSDSAMCAAAVATAGVATTNARLDLDTRGGALCEGQPFEPRLTVDAPSRVHVYDVASDGSAWHIWPEPGGSGLVQGTVSLGTSFATAPVAPGDETLVAVILPASAPSGPQDAASGFCRVPGTFSLSALPPGARVATASWHIDTRAGACGPPPAGQPTRDQLAAAIAAAPACR